MTTSFQIRTQAPERSSILKVVIGISLLLAPSLPFAHQASAQALPAAEAAPISTGFELPHTAGTLQASVGASEGISSGYYSNSGVGSTTGINGDLALITSSKLYPFSMVFSGGRYWSTSSQPSPLYLNLALSQVVTRQHWNFVVADSVSYLPETPSGGISGIPGTGDLGVPPIQVGIDTGQGVLTAYSTRLGNIATVSAQRSITAKTSIAATGSYNTLQFLGNSNGLNTNGEVGNIGLNHRIDARNSVSANYTYAKYTYGGNLPGFNSQTASGTYAHRFSRKLDMSASAGPQWSAGTATSTTPASPTNVNLYANFALNYAAQLAYLSLDYSRGTNGGFGVINGAISDSVSFRASRTFTQVWNVAFTSSFTHTTNLLANGAGAGAFAPETFVDAAQLSRAVGRHLSVYASYTLEDQKTSGSSAAVNEFNGFFQVASFGLTYSPTPIHFGR